LASLVVFISQFERSKLYPLIVRGVFVVVTVPENQRPRETSAQQKYQVYLEDCGLRMKKAKVAVENNVLRKGMGNNEKK
jgi:sulfur carrier protein ThiS